MKKMLLLLIGAAAFACGCSTAGVKGVEAKDSVIGTPVETVIKAHAGQRIRFFTPKGKEMKKLHPQQGGSVSIYNKEITGQDNYVFNKDGVITKHRRSYGEDYSKGVWRKVK